MKLIIVLLGLGVCACCAYGMSQIDPQLIPKGLNVITDLKVTFIKLQQSTTRLLTLHVSVSRAYSRSHS